MFFDEIAEKLGPALNGVGKQVAEAVKQLGRNQTRMLAMQAILMNSSEFIEPEEVARRAEEIARAMEKYDA